MNDFRIDKAMLEKNSSEEILRILREEQDDYTPEAIRLFKQILEERGMNLETASSKGAAQSSLAPRLSGRQDGEGKCLEKALIHSPADAIHALNEILQNVLEGKTDPQTGQAAAHIIGTMLQAMERRFMTDSEEDS